MVDNIQINGQQKRVLPATIDFFHNSKIPCCVSDSHGSRQDGDVVDVNLSAAAV